MPHDFSFYVVGSGDAYDSERTNASLLVQESSYSLLIDCGPWVPKALMGHLSTPEQVDSIYITHSHPDHCAGLTTLLNWMDAKGRKKPMTIVAQKAQWEVLKPLVDFAYWPLDGLGFELIWQDSGEVNRIGPWSVKTAPTQHAVSNLSLQLTRSAGQKMFYSGDGKLLEQGRVLAAQSDWVFVECETIMVHDSHGSWQEIQSYTRKRNSLWWLYHIDPQCRPNLAEKVEKTMGLNIAEDGYCYKKSETREFLVIHE
ncbi:MBL fold metallo-hydrolase [Photobacterium sp. DNB23_23_1]|uniref:MBL fold metallo-hydrolase n=1 Tax=Photobacterium pectinilyticum TaxID=2906793 RepID=A0ABT1N1Y7_9GAMM|nr:MBL fold metallo-hydrolase [Photobacterium sp. ZSDE20]MCQ1058733.1 MBL fold metallo-hydrolase [Photobacterium sp. ZSDE20]MDD1823515.1 MBL fold metallo-hydrolase [Photobacterium sp. ZSDE20]